MTDVVGQRDLSMTAAVLVDCGTTFINQFRTHTQISAITHFDFILWSKIMKTISVSSVLKRTSLLTALAAMMSVGSVAVALNGQQLNQFITSKNSTHANELQLAKVECKGNWVNSGCTSPPPSASGGQGSAPATNDDCPALWFFKGGCGGK